MDKPLTRIEGKPLHPPLTAVSYLDNKYLRRREGDFTDSRMSAKLGSLPLSMLALLPEQHSGIAIEGTTNPDFSFEIHLTEIPELAAGRMNSRHEVKFGQLHINGNYIVSATELVALKFLHRITATREINAAREINHRFGEDVAFTSQGFLRQAGTDTIGHISKYEHGVVSLDNILWDKNTNPTLREEAMGLAGLWLASLHNHQIIHGDAQAKNIARDSSQRLRYPDLEGAMTYSPHDPMSRVQRLGDIGDLFHRVYMPLTTNEEDEAFTEAYLEHQVPHRHYIDGHDIRKVIEQKRSEDVPFSA